MQSWRLGDIPQEDWGSCSLLLSNKRSLLAWCWWNDLSSRAVSQGYVRDMPRHIYIQPGGGCISDTSICKKMQNRVNLGLNRRIFMSKTHMFLCFYVFGNAPLWWLDQDFLHPTPNTLQMLQIWCPRFPFMHAANLCFCAFLLFDANDPQICKNDYASRLAAMKKTRIL